MLQSNLSKRPYLPCAVLPLRETQRKASPDGLRVILTRQNTRTGGSHSMTDAFDPKAELEAVKAKRAMQRRTTYRKSKLERYRAELVAMREAGASSQDLAVWLRMKHRLKIHRSSIDRFLAQVPELAKASTPPTPTPTEPVEQVFELQPPDSDPVIPRVPLSMFDDRTNG